MLGLYLLNVLFVAWIVMAIFGPIAVKAGYSKWYALLMLVPYINIVVVWVFAFSKWPSQSSA